MPDRTDSGQGRDALDAAMDALEDAIITDQLEMRLPLHAPAARAAVRKAAREMGEEYTVEKYLGMAIFNAVRLPNTYAPGQRVRVVRV